MQTHVASAHEVHTDDGPAQARPHRYGTTLGRRVGISRIRTAGRVRVAIALAVAAAVFLVGAGGGRSLLAAIVAGAAAGACALLLPVPGRRALPVRSVQGRDGMRLLDLGVRLVLGGGALWVAANVALNPQPGTTRYAPSENSGWDPALTCVLAVVLLLLVPRWWRVCSGLASLLTAGGRTRPIVLIAAATLLVAQLLTAWAMAKMPGFDAGIIIQSSYRHAFPVAGDQGAISYYYMGLPNNLLFGFATYLYFMAWSLIGISSLPVMLTVLIWLNALILDVGVVLAFLVARRLGGLRLGVFTLPALVLFVVFSPWLNTPYSDTLALTCSIALVWLWLRTSQRRSFPHLVALGALAAAGVLLKPTVAAVLVAIAVVEVVRDPPSLRRRHLGAARGIAAVGVVLAVLGTGTLAVIGASGFVSFNPLANPEALPITNFMVYGAHGTGGYNADDIAQNWTMPAERRLLFNLKRYVTIVWQTGLFDYLLFLGGKALWMFADGSFFQGREGDGNLLYLHQDTLALALRSAFARDGADHVVVASLWQAGWIVLVILVALSVLVPTARRLMSPSIVLRGSLVLLALFLLFSEGRSRYVYPAVPFVILLAGLTVSSAGGLLRHDVLTRLPSLVRGRTAGAPAIGEPAGR